MKCPGVAVAHSGTQTSGRRRLLVWCVPAVWRKLRASFALGLGPPNCCPCVLSCSCLVSSPQRESRKTCRSDPASFQRSLSGQRASPAAAGCSGWLHPATCLSPGSPTCPCSSAPSSLRMFPAASPVASLPPAHCQIPSKCHSKTPLTKLGLCYVAGHRQAARPPPRLVPPCACVVATACSQEDGGPECSPRSLRTGSGSSQRQALRGARCGRGLGGCP